MDQHVVEVFQKAFPYKLTMTNSELTAQSGIDNLLDAADVWLQSNSLNEGQYTYQYVGPEVRYYIINVDSQYYIFAVGEGCTLICTKYLDKATFGCYSYTYSY